MSDTVISPRTVAPGDPTPAAGSTPPPSSTVPTPSPPDRDRIRIAAVDPDDVILVGGSALAALAATWLLYGRLLPLSGGLGFWLCWYVTFLVSVHSTTRALRGPVHARDQVARVIVWSGGIGVLVPLLLVVAYTIGRGYHALRPSFFVEDQRFVGALSESTEGGGAHAIIGTLQQIGLALVISVPLGVMSAVYLSEVRGKMAKPLRTATDAMSAVPSIVSGLFIYAVWILTFGADQSGFAGSLALSVLFLPTVTRTSEVVLRLVPGGLREASLALGGGEWETTSQVVLPTARSGLATAVILGMARVIGETAPLILTIGGAFVVNTNPFSGKQDALPYFVYRLVRFPQDSQIDRAWTGALVLLMLVLVLFVIARMIGGRGPDHIGRLRRRRLQKRGLA